WRRLGRGFDFAIAEPVCLHVPKGGGGSERLPNSSIARILVLLNSGTGFFFIGLALSIVTTKEVK
ncbi:hypothetical protein, partial [Imhoffiella purpurea]|uniref:hypothetical protein n=1 Tax=Imhoffiella purpurea TaxID=1249627 RepID=UPI001E5BD042